MSVLAHEPKRSEAGHLRIKRALRTPAVYRTLGSPVDWLVLNPQPAKTGPPLGAVRYVSAAGLTLGKCSQ